MVLLIGLLLWQATGNSLFLLCGLAGCLLFEDTRPARSMYGGAAEFREDGLPVPSTPFGTNGVEGKSWVDSLSLVDPRFNLREVAKQLILLEDHLFHINKHCLDCISKHSLCIEAFLEEAITLDSTGVYHAEILEVLVPFKAIMYPLIEKMKDKTVQEEDFDAAANQMRKLRKPLAKKYSYFAS